MPQDAFTLKYVAKELNETFEGGKISKINQPSKDTLSLLIYTQKGNVKLTCDFSAKFCRVSRGETFEYPNPDVAPSFCMLLRKHLQNAEVTRVAQVGGERIIYFDFKCFSEFEISDVRLYCEIMGKYSNAILVRDGVILGALKTAGLETGARRVTLSGAKYALPPAQDKAPQDDFAAIKKAFNLWQGGDAAKFISDKIAGVAYTTAKDIAAKYGDDITPQKIYDYLHSESYSPCVVYLNGEPCDFKAAECEYARMCDSLLEAQRIYYDFAVGKKQFEDAKRRLNSALASAVKKVEKRLAGIREKLEECLRMEDVKLRGELITANIYAVERGADKLIAVNYYDEKGGTVEIALEPRLTPSQNAQKYYKKYAKLKRTKVNLDAQLEEETGKEDYLKTVQQSLDCAENVADLAEIEEELISLSLLPSPKSGSKNKKKKPQIPFRVYEYGGYKIMCGRNNTQNDRLLKELEPNDVWLHAKNFHSAHVGIMCGGRQVDERTIAFAAEVCAYYSDARGNTKVPVDYTLKKHVKKPPHSAAGFVTYTDFKTILTAPCAHSEERKDG